MIQWLRELVQKYIKFRDWDWRHVPPPNWKSSRGGGGSTNKDYW